MKSFDKTNRFEGTIKNDFTKPLVKIAFFLTFLESLRLDPTDRILPHIPEVLFIYFILTIFICILNKGLRIKELLNANFILIISYCFVIVFSTFYSALPLDTFSRAIQFIVIAFGTYLLISTSNDETEILNLIYKYIIIFCCILSVYGIALFHLGDITLKNNTYYMELGYFGIDFRQVIHGKRISSVLGNPNFLGMWMMYGSIICLYMLTKPKNKVLYILLSILFIYTLKLTGSRASMVGLAVGCLLFINYGLIKKNIYSLITQYLLVLFLIVSLLFALNNIEIVDSIGRLIGRASSNLSGREMAWIALLENIKEKPFFGIGYRVSKEVILAKDNINFPHAHNLHLSIISELGLYGFMIFILIYSLPFFTYLKKSKKFNPKQNMTYVSLLAILGAFLVHQIFEDMYSPLGFTFILSITIIAIANRINNKIL